MSSKVFTIVMLILAAVVALSTTLYMEHALGDYYDHLPKGMQHGAEQDNELPCPPAIGLALLGSNHNAYHALKNLTPEQEAKHNATKPWYIMPAREFLQALYMATQLRALICYGLNERELEGQEYIWHEDEVPNA